MKVKRMGITKNLRRIWLFSANKIKSSESVSKQPTQLIVELNSSLQQKSGTMSRARPKGFRDRLFTILQKEPVKCSSQLVYQ